MILNEKQKELSLMVQVTLKNKINDDKLSRSLRSNLKNRVENIKLINSQSTRNNNVEFSMEELYWIAKFIINNANQYDIDFKLNSKKIIIEDYFETKEIHIAEQYYIKDEVDKDFIIINNVDEVPDGSYVCSQISIKELTKWWRDGRLNYNLDTQRESVLSKIGISETGYIRKPTIHAKNVAEIKDAILNNEFEYNCLTINILQTGMEEYNYDEKNRVLTIYNLCSGKSYVDLLDGCHRCEGSAQAIESNPNIEGYFQLKIRNINTEQAQGLVYQAQKASPIEEEKKLSLEQNKFNKTVKLLNINGNKDSNSMRYKITDVPEEVSISKEAYCLVSTISQTLKDKWGDVMLLQRDNNKVASFLVEFFNEITGLRNEDFVNFKKRKSIATSENMFIFYTYLSKKLYLRKDWRELLELFINDIDFSEQNPIWKELQITSKRDDKSIRTKIYNYIDTKFEAYEEVV